MLKKKQQADVNILPQILSLDETLMNQSDKSKISEKLLTCK
jgi:hypothetical protein